MNRLNLKSWLATLRADVREKAVASGLGDPNKPPAPRPCKECGTVVAPKWSDGGGVWLFPACGEVLACRLKKEGASATKAYEAAVQRARVPMRMRGLSLVEREGRSVLSVDKKNKALAEACYAWDAERWIVASGTVGSGKTSWLTALLLEHLVSNPDCNARWTSEQRLYRKAALHADRSHAGREKVLQEFMDASVLLLDDLGASRRDLTEWQGGAMRDLLMERHLAAAPTLISTNLSLEGIGKRYGDHVASRIAELAGGIIVVNGFDRRQKKRRTAR